MDPGKHTRTDLKNGEGVKSLFDGILSDELKPFFEDSKLNVNLQNKENIKVDNTEIEICDAEWLEELPDVEVVETKIDDLRKEINQALTKAFQRFKGEVFIVPIALVWNVFKFKKDENGVLRLEKVEEDFWNAVRLYLLLQFKAREQKSNTFVAGIRFLKEGLCVKYATLKRALSILKRANLIKTVMKGKPSRAAKHFITIINERTFPQGNVSLGNTNTVFKESGGKI